MKRKLLHKAASTDLESKTILLILWPSEENKTLFSNTHLNRKICFLMDCLLLQRSEETPKKKNWTPPWAVQRLPRCAVEVQWDCPAYTATSTSRSLKDWTFAVQISIDFVSQTQPSVSSTKCNVTSSWSVTHRGGQYQLVVLFSYCSELYGLHQSCRPLIWTVKVLNKAGILKHGKCFQK